MENKIVRLLILRDVQEGSKKISGFVVLRDDDTLEIINSIDTKTINQIMNELMKDYPEVLNDVSDKKNANDITKAFKKNGYIIEAGSKKNVIVHLFFDANRVLEIEYADGNKISFKKSDEEGNSLKDKYYEYLEILKDQYNLENVEDFETLCDSNFIVAIPYEEDDYSGNHHNRYYFDDDDFDEDEDDYADEEIRDNNGLINNIINKLIVHKKLIALITAGAVLVVTGHGFYKIGKKNGENNIATPASTPISTPVPTPSPSPTATPTSIPTVEPTHEVYMSTPNPYPNVVATTSVPVVELPQIRPNYQTTYMTQEELALEPMPYQIESYDSIDSPELWTYIYPEYEDTINIGDVDISNLNIENLFEVSNNNMWDLSNYAFNGTDNQNLETTPMRIHFEKIVPGLSDVDKYYIKYFNDLRNEIVYQGFNLSNPNKALECNRYVIYELIRCKVYNQPLRLNINGQEIFARYSDLGYEAQYVIEQLCWGNYLLMGTDTVEFDGQIYDQDQLGYDVWGLRPEASPKF